MRDYEKLQRDFSEGRLGRRAFLKRATAMGMLAAVPAGVLAAEARAAAPKRGGVLRQALRGGATSDTLRGSGLLDSHNSNTSWQVRNTITGVAADGAVEGEIVESWESTPDAAQWTFKLKKGVEFHNGKSLTPEDIIFSINDHRGPDSTSGGAGAVSGIEDIVADGKDHVVFKLKSGNADFPFLLSDYHLIIAPEGTADGDWDKGMGTGPFSLKSYEPGVRSHTVRNPNYHKEGQPYFDEVETLNVLDVTARISAMQTGDVDCIEEPDLKTMHLLEKTPGISIKEAGGTKHFTYPMLTGNAPYDNNDVRTAIKLGVDREALLQTILKGHGYIGNDHPIGKSQRYYASEIEQRPYDPEKAKWHLKQAGLDSVDLTLHAGDIFTGGVDSAILMKEHLAKAGINVNVVREPTDGYWANVWLKQNWCVSYWSGRATEDWMFSTAYLSSAAWNDMGPWKHERFDQLLVAARAELDEAKRREMYVEMQRIVRDEGGALIPVFANFVAAVSDKVGTPEQIGGNWAMDGHKNTERWWFV